MGESDDVRAGLRTRCVGCEELLSRVELESHLFVCTRCGYHFRLSAEQRLGRLLDRGSFAEIDAALGSRDSLGFPDQPPYEQRLAEMAADSSARGGRDGRGADDASEHGGSSALAPATAGRCRLTDDR